MDCSSPGSSVHEIFQARLLEWLPLPNPGDLPDSGIEPTSLVSPALAGRFFTTSTIFWLPCNIFHIGEYPTLDEFMMGDQGGRGVREASPGEVMMEWKFWVKKWLTRKKGKTQREL